MKISKILFPYSQLKTLNFSFKIFLLIFDSVWCKIWAIRQKYSTNAELVAFFGQLWSFVFLDLRSEKVISTKILKFKKLQRHKVNIKRKVKLRRLFGKKTQWQSCESIFYPKSGLVLCKDGLTFLEKMTNFNLSNQ